MRKMTPMLCALWILSSAGIAGIITATASSKPQATTVTKAAPTHNVNRIWKADKLKPSTLPPKPPKVVPALNLPSRWV